MYYLQQGIWFDTYIIDFENKLFEVWCCSQLGFLMLMPAVRVASD